MSPSLKNELKGIALLLLGVFITGALAWQGVADIRGVEDSVGGFGVVGSSIAGPLATFFGWPSVWLIPVAIGIRALGFFGRVDPIKSRGLLLLSIGLVALAPVIIGVALGGSRDTVLWQGIWGGIISFLLIHVAGQAGAWIVLLLVVSALTAITLSWNPLRILIGRRKHKVAARHPVLTAPVLDANSTPDDSKVPADERAGRKQSRAEQFAPDPEDLPAIDPSLFFTQKERANFELDPPRTGASTYRSGTASGATAGAAPGAATPSAPVAVPETENTGSSNARAEVRATDTEPDREHEADEPDWEDLIDLPDESPPQPEEEEYDDELPPVSLLSTSPPRDEQADRRELDLAGERLVDTLRTFKIHGTLVGRTTGPAVTQYEVAPGAGVKVRQIANLSNDLALAMRAQSIRVVAPIPGKAAVGIEVPNPSPEIVGFRELIESPEFQNARAALPIALGKDLEGKPVIADLAKMPHLLIAGATGAGKSVCINTIISSLLYRHTKQTLRFLMIDPKMVELSVYNQIPHLRHKVVTDNRDAAAVLKWAVILMQERYALLAENGARNLEDFNKKVRSGAAIRMPKQGDTAFENVTYTKGELPYIVLIIDELADLMMTVQGEVETPLAMLAQKARAIGIHLILATQRPSVNVITGLIKANFPSRIAFRVASQVDSRTILDGMGAESLLGNGDMLFIPPGKSEPSRLQGAYISSDDTERLMDWYEKQREEQKAAYQARMDLLLGITPDAEGPESEPGTPGTGEPGSGGISPGQIVTLPDEEEEEDILEIVARHTDQGLAGGEDGEAPDEEERDKLFRSAAEVVIQHKHGSTSLLQRRLKIGYGRAARIMDQLEFAGVLGPADGPRPREVLMGFEDLDRIAPK